MKIRKLVIPVAGMGTRFLPVTKCIPKEMLPIVDVPTIELLLNEAKEAGIEEVIFVTNDKKKAIEEHFKKDNLLEDKLRNDSKLELLNKVENIGKGLTIKTVIQDKPLGSGHAVNLARDLVDGEDFAVMYGDDLIKGGCALKELIEVYNKYDSCVIGLQEVPYSLTYKYGIVSLSDKDTLKINNIVEKPKDNPPSNLAGLGRYILKNEIFDVLDKLPKGINGEYQLTDAFKIMMNEKDFYGCKFTGTYYDIGSQLGYIKANIMYGLDRDDINDSLIDFMKNIVK